jgi:hypothetical protein
MRRGAVAVQVAESDRLALTVAQRIAGNERTRGTSLAASLVNPDLIRLPEVIGQIKVEVALVVEIF